MNASTSLTVTDPLAGQAVKIVITLPADEGRLETRPALLSLGGGRQAPIFQQGTLADIAALIETAWTAYGLRVELAAAGETTEEEIAAVAVEPATAAPDADAAPIRPRNLSLF